MKNDELLQLAEMFDTIVNSNNPAVQRSLQYTAVLAKLADEKQNSEDGPFVKMFSMMQELRTEMSSLRRSVQILENNRSGDSYYTTPYQLDPIIDIANLNMNSGISALTAAQISAITGNSSADVQWNTSDITISLSDSNDVYTIDDKIKF